MTGRPYTCSIENVVATASIDEYIDVYGRLDLSEIPGVEYRPEMFPGAVYRLKKPKSAILIFSSGKLVTTGTKSEKEAKKVIKKVVEELGRAYGRKIKTPEVNIQNIVATINFGDGIDLEKAMYSLPYKIMYEPEQFPGEVVRLREEGVGRKKHNVVALLFTSGKCVLTGAKSENEVYEVLDELYEHLEKEELFFER